MKESEARVTRLFRELQKAPGFEGATRTEILLQAQRLFQVASLQNIRPLLVHLMQTFLAPLSYSIGERVPVAVLRDGFFGMIEQVGPGIADQLRNEKTIFDWFTLGRLTGLQSDAEQTEWAIARLEIRDERPQGPYLNNVTLKNGKVFLCHAHSIACLEPHAVFPGEKSIHVRHTGAILEFTRAKGGKADLRFDLFDQDKVSQITLFNVAYGLDSVKTEMLIRSAIITYLENMKS